MSDVEKLKALLDTDENGEEIAKILNRLIIDENKRNLLVMKLVEIEKEFATYEQEISFTKSEETVMNTVISNPKPLTTDEITKKVGDKFKSLQHKSHVSATLQSLIRKGVLGKFRFHREVYFTNAKNAVVETMKQRGELPSECSPNEISNETGIPIPIVLDIIEELLT